MIADVIARLSAELSAAPSVLADPAVARELRLQSLALGRLLSALRLPSTYVKSAPRPQYRGQRGFYALPGGA